MTTLLAVAVNWNVGELEAAGWGVVEGGGVEGGGVGWGGGLN